MKLTKEQKKTSIIASMLVGGNAEELSKEYGVNISTIRMWMNKERANAERDEVINLDSVVLEAVSQEIMNKAENNPTVTTKQLNKLDKGLVKLKDGVAGLEMLESEFHDSIMKLLTWANNKISDEMKVSEWTQLVNGITSLHSTLFSKGSNTQINLMQQNNNNNASSAKVEKFKGGFRT